jgi:chemotaxis protein methyltransferase CheR
MMLLHKMNLLDRTEIYATDINTDVMKTAKTGIYKYRFNQEYLDSFDTVINNGKNEKNKTPYTRYFFIDKVKDTFQMKQFLVKKPVYKKVDLVRDECPFDIKFDLIVCRNVIIYFNYELQNKVFQMFHSCLNPEACLMLGWHESIIGTTSTLYDKKNQLYFKK